MTSMMEQHEDLRRSSVIALTDEQIHRMAADGQDPSRFSYRVWQQAVRQLLVRLDPQVVMVASYVGDGEPEREVNLHPTDLEVRTRPSSGPRLDSIREEWERDCDATASHPYGHCPNCGAPGHVRERRPGGKDRCFKGCSYPSVDMRPCGDVPTCRFSPHFTGETDGKQ